MELYSRVYREKVSGAWCWIIEDKAGNTSASGRGCKDMACAMQERDSEFRSICLAELPAVHRPENERVDYNGGHTTASVWRIDGKTFGAVHQQQNDGTRAMLCYQYDNAREAWFDVRSRAADLRG